MLKIRTSFRTAHLLRYSIYYAFQFTGITFINNNLHIGRTGRIEVYRKAIHKLFGSSHSTINNWRPLLLFQWSATSNNIKEILHGIRCMHNPLLFCSLNCSSLAGIGTNFWSFLVSPITRRSIQTDLVQSSAFL